MPFSRRSKLNHRLTYGLLTDTFSSYDQELPIECDDEYWTGTETSPAFHQPHGQPSSISFWNILIRLNDVLGLVQRSMVRTCPITTSDLYSYVPQYGVNTNFPPTTEVAIRLDTELNKWIELIPAHREFHLAHRSSPTYHCSSLERSNCG